MVDGEVGEGTRALTPANENPWYVLMTLYGEQDGEKADPPLHVKNRAAWNAGSCQGMSDEERHGAAKSSDVTVEELAGWKTRADDIVRCHAAEMTARNGAEFSYPGLPGVDRPIDLSWVAFPNRVCANRMVFGGGVMFGSAMFSGSAVFGFATFNGPALFGFAKFSESAFFGFATFGGLVVFGAATFSGDAEFGTTTFSEDAWFVSATFSGEASFASATFSGEALFNSAMFSGDVQFDSALFGGYAYFTKAVFGSEGQNRRGRFVDCKFQSPANFRAATFRNRYPNFSAAVLHEKTIFTADDAHWPKMPNDPVDAKASCAVIRHTGGKQGLPEDEHYFFRREMGFAAQIGGFWDRLPYRLFGAVSDYAYSIARPVLWLVALWLVGAVIFLLSWRTCYCIGDLQNAPLAGSLSISNIFNFFGFQRSYLGEDIIKGLGGWLHLLSAVQTILGFTLLFFLGLGLRTRFRMR